MKIATWNVNSVRARLARLLPWLEQESPDIVCLQETKVQDLQFPREEIEDAGYNVEVFGQKTYNGVAILSQHPIHDVIRGFDDDDESADKRVLGAEIEGYAILDLYVPNGKQVGHESYEFKLAWLERLRRLLDERFSTNDRVVVCGDFNVTFDDRDIHDPAAWHEKILCSTPERKALTHVMDFGLTDALRRFHEGDGPYTWWDHRAGSFARDHGLRIDHFLLSEPALAACTGVHVDREMRTGRSPSDHAPVIATFET